MGDIANGVTLAEDSGGWIDDPEDLMRSMLIPKMMVLLMQLMKESLAGLLRIFQWKKDMTSLK